MAKDTEIIKVLKQELAFEKEVRAEPEKELNKSSNLVYELVLINDLFNNEYTKLKERILELERINRILELKVKHEKGNHPEQVKKKNTNSELEDLKNYIYKEGIFHSRGNKGSKQIDKNENNDTKNKKRP